MAQVISVGTATPPYTIDQTTAREFAKKLFADHFPDIERYLPIFENTHIHTRAISKPLHWFEKEHSFKERNDWYVELSCELGEKAITSCLQKGNMSPREVDHIIFISTTGFATPSIDAHLIQRLGFSSHVKRTPIWGLGCAGGVAGLARAYEYVKAFPEQHVLVLSIELCSLTFRKQDRSKSNLVATSLFADGAAAVLISGEQVKHKESYPKICSVQSTIWDDSLDVMGWDLESDGLKVIFSRDIPTIVKKYIPQVITTFLQQEGLRLEDITRMIFHPGGRKVLEAYEQALDLPKELFQTAYDVLHEYGNMSSTTVLFILERELCKPAKQREWGLMSALGPGFSSELLLIEWQ